MCSSTPRKAYFDSARYGHSTNRKGPIPNKEVNNSVVRLRSATTIPICTIRLSCTPPGSDDARLAIMPGPFLVLLKSSSEITSIHRKNHSRHHGGSVRREKQGWAHDFLR